MSIEENKALVRRFIAALLTDGDLGAVDEYQAADFVNHDPPIGLGADAEGMRTATRPEVDVRANVSEVARLGGGDGRLGGGACWAGSWHQRAPCLVADMATLDLRPGDGYGVIPAQD